jgi:glycerol-3-phosphate acyltransferase PlsY
MPVSSQTLALTAGGVVMAAAAIGSIPFGYVLERRALRRDLRRLESPRQLEMQLRALVAGTASDPDAAPPPRSTDLAAAVLDTAKVLVAATLAWHVMLRVAPGRGHFGHTESGIAFTANQVIAFWQSAGLWAGAAAVTAHFAPVGVRRRGGQGQAPALGLAFVYCPIGFSVGVAAFFAALTLTRDVTRSVLVALPAFVAYAWLGWAFDWKASWGVTNGPELTLWATVVAGVAAAAAVAQTRRATPPQT